MAPPRNKVAAFLCAGAFAFVGATLTWIVWGVLTPGDYFANGSPLVIPTLVASAAFGAFVGRRLRRRWPLAVIVVAGGLALAFWLLVPDGWWVTPPPPRPDVPRAPMGVDVEKEVPLKRSFKMLCITNATDNSGKTPLSVAWNDETKKFLKKHGAKE